MQILEGEKVSKSFGGLAAVTDVSFGVEQGMVFGVIGPNGAGKTTLFNLISAALALETGCIRFKGRDITGLKPYKICRLGIARTFQTVKIFQNLSVLENVILGAFFGSQTRVGAGEAAREAEVALEAVGLYAARYGPAKDLTLARQKRLEVARALATRPDLLLLDEMMAGLTPTEVEQAMGLVKELRDGGMTILMIEHVMKAVMNMCDRILVLDHGRKIAEGTPREIASNRKVIEVYL
ncbi:MAG: ABC transporter ATP-binding protein, partial [Desulfobacteraceae bacterium]